MLVGQRYSLPISLSGLVAYWRWLQPYGYFKVDVRCTCAVCGYASQTVRLNSYVREFGSPAGGSHMKYCSRNIRSPDACPFFFYLGNPTFNIKGTYWPFPHYEDLRDAFPSQPHHNHKRCTLSNRRRTQNCPTSSPCGATSPAEAPSEPQAQQ